MEETSEENTTGSGCETKHGKENSDNGNDEKCDDDDGKQSDVITASIVTMTTGMT